jgi:uncharacterized protein YabE (DUF348 family)
MKQTLVMSRIPVISENILSRKVENKTSVISLTDDEFYFELDGVMSRVWTSIDGTKSLAEILDEIKVETPDKFHIRLETDFTNFIEELTQNNLIKLA